VLSEELNGSITAELRVCSAALQNIAEAASEGNQGDPTLSPEGANSTSENVLTHCDRNIKYLTHIHTNEPLHFQLKQKKGLKAKSWGGQQLQLGQCVCFRTNYSSEVAKNSCVYIFIVERI